MAALASASSTPPPGSQGPTARRSSPTPSEVVKLQGGKARDPWSVRSPGLRDHLDLREGADPRRPGRHRVECRHRRRHRLRRHCAPCRPPGDRRGDGDPVRERRAASRPRRIRVHPAGGSGLDRPTGPAGGRPLRHGRSPWRVDHRHLRRRGCPGRPSPPTLSPASGRTSTCRCSTPWPRRW